MTQQDRDNYLNIMIDASTSVRDALATSFIAWCLKKVNNLPAFDPNVNEITSMSLTYPGRLMDDDKKIEILQKLEKLGVLSELPVQERKEE